MMNSIKGNKIKYSLIGIVAVSFVFTVIIPNFAFAQASIQPGTLSYQCLYNPFRIQLNWTNGVNANSNSIEKGDVDPSDDNRFWAFIFQDSSLAVRTHTDTNVQQGISYSYRVKYAPQVPSNVVVVNCGGNNTPVQPIVDIKANGSDGPVSIPNNTAATISWTSTNAASCTVTPGGFAGTSGSQSSGNLTVSRTYFITCFDAGNNNSATDQVTVNVQAAPLPPIVDIKANGSDGPIIIQSGASASLSWTSQNTTSCTVTPGGFTGTSGSASTGNLTTSRTYNLSCTNGTQTANDSVTVNVQAVQLPPSVDLKVNSQDGTIMIQSGGSATLTWTSTDASYCSITPSNYVGISGSASTGALNSSQTYTITCNGTNGGQATDSVTVNVQAGQATADIKVNGSDSAITVQSGTSATLSWTSTGVTYCSIAPSNYVGISGSASTGALNNTVTYTVNCTGNNSVTASDSVTVNVQGVTTNQQPTVTLNANPTSVNTGGASTLTWTSTNATSCSASGGWSGSKALSGNEATYPASTNTYSIVCTNGSGQQATAQATISVNGQNPQNPTVDIKVNGSDGTITIQSGSSATLSWTSTNATYCSITPSNYVGTSGSASTGPLTSNQNYVLTCNTTNGTQTDSVAVNVQGTQTNNNQQPTVTLNANPTSVNTGQSTTLYWTSTNATSCTVSGSNWSGSRSISGSDVVTPSQTGTYTITCYGNGGSVNAQTTVLVNGISNPTGGNLPTVSLVAIPQGNGNYLLSWVSSNATSCSASGGWSGSKALSGNEVVRPNGTNTYNIICTNGNGSANDARTISAGGQVLGVGDIVTGPENPLPWMLTLGFIGSITLHVIFFRKREENKEVSLDEVLATLRSAETAPDTSTLATP